MAVNGAQSQYSGTLMPSVLPANGDEGQRRSDTLGRDDAAARGLKVEAESDPPQAKELSAACCPACPYSPRNPRTSCMS